jgi:hypothetical protein
MSSLRSLIDGSLSINAEPVKQDTSLRVQQDVVIRRATSRSGPTTHEVIVGKIMSMGDTTATVAIQKAGGIVQKREVRLSEISPVTNQFRMASIQFKPVFRSRA